MFSIKNGKVHALAALTIGATLVVAGCGPAQGWSGVPEAPPPPPPPPVVVAPPPEVEPPPPPAKLDIHGDVQFDVGKASINDNAESEDVLNQVLKILHRHKHLTKLRVEGHTDNSGSAASNVKLSQARAASVVAWLTAKGIDPGRLSADGCGSKVPLVPNNSAAHKAQNRRTEFHVMEYRGEKPAGFTEACTADKH
jgi:OOP family OmpA-OmpF porin